MASVSSLDKDLRKMRLDKYTPAAANEVKIWIEGVLGEPLPSSDLLEGLKDGVALCRLINLAVGPPGVKFKKSAMPFVQMENISHYLRACQTPPLNMPDHDMFLTVDLYEQKDPAQVLQCLGAFSRVANAANPSAFPSAIGVKPRSNMASPQNTGITPSRSRGFSNVSNNSSAYGSRVSATKTGDSGSGRWSPTKSPTGDRVGSPSVSSWSKKDHEGVTSPAWNIAQYGYMGGASQGNLGIAFGGRRQITSAGPKVPTLAEKERKRKEQEAEAERQRQQMEEEERRRRAQAEEDERQARLDEEHRWEEETRRLRAEEKRKAEEEKQRWDEEERQWRATEEKRRQEEEEVEAKIMQERQRSKSKGDNRLHGQFLSQYQAENGAQAQTSEADAGSGYSDRVKQLEQELELARQREKEYEEERHRRLGRPSADAKSRVRSRSRPNKDRPERPPSRQESWSRNDREYLQTQWDNYQDEQQQPQQQSAPAPPPRPLPTPAPLKSQRSGDVVGPPPIKPKPTSEGRPLPVPQKAPVPPTTAAARSTSGASPGSLPPRPLPSPSASSPSVHPPPAAAPAASRTDRFLSANPAPAPPPKQTTYARELDATAERDEEDRRRAQSQAATKAGGWASKSLLEREMEMERQRQREWEEAQKETAAAAAARGDQGDGVDGIGGGIGGRWDVGQWAGFTGGDSQNKGSTGIGAGRRQIVGPRPLPGRP